MKLRVLDPITVGGLTSLTTIDYPGELAAVIFCQGCPWRCGYCQNADLIPRRSDHTLPWRDVLSFLKRRRGLLDAVVFSGGEPTLQRGLGDAVEQVKQLGYKTGLHTAGPYPQRLSELLPSLDWVALDIKAPRALYPQVTNMPGSGDKAWESARLVITSGIDYEIRTTVHPDQLPKTAITKLVEDLGTLGVKRYRLQACVYAHCSEPSIRSPKRPIDLSSLAASIKNQIPDFAVRSA